MQSYKAQDRFKCNIIEEVSGTGMLYDQELMNPQDIQGKIFMSCLCLLLFHAV